MATFRSTYAATYLPPMVASGSTLIAPDPDGCPRQWRPPRQFPIIPTGPHRPLVPDMPLGPGIGTRALDTISHLGPKDIVNTKPPRQLLTTKLPPSRQPCRAQARRVRLPRVTDRPGRTRRYYVHDMKGLVDDINCDDLRWITTSQQVSEEVKLPKLQVEPPSSTFELSADQVVLRPQRYETEADMWQKVATSWDRCQYRPSMDSVRRERQAEGFSPKPPRQLLRGPAIGDVATTEDKILHLIRNNKLAPPYERPCPGYAGFKPRFPIEAALERIPLPTDKIQTLMKQSYKSYTTPADFQKTKYPHLGPMSRTVTLTYPYNPFNKVENEGLCILTTKRNNIM